MHLIMGIFAGALIGWIAYLRLEAFQDQGLRPCLFFGAVGGALGALATPMLTASAPGGPVSTSLVLICAAGAVAVLYASNFVARHLDA